MWRAVAQVGSCAASGTLELEQCHLHSPLCKQEQLWCTALCRTGSSVTLSSPQRNARVSLRLCYSHLYLTLRSFIFIVSPTTRMPDPL